MTSLALKLCPQVPSQWPDFPSSCIQGLSSLGASAESLLDLLAIIAEEVDSADLLQPHIKACFMFAGTKSIGLGFGTFVDVVCG